VLGAGAPPYVVVAFSSELNGVPWMIVSTGVHTSSVFNNPSSGIAVDWLDV
jgi:hypothetical protein